jgi:hypothetical protein
MRNEITRLLLSLATKNDWEINQLDAVITFLNSQMDREIYIWLLKDYEISSGMIYKMKLAFYNMKQSAKLWADICGEGLRSKDYIQSQYNSCLWYRITDSIYITIYIDDFEIFALIWKIINAVK